MKLLSLIGTYYRTSYCHSCNSNTSLLSVMSKDIRMLKLPMPNFLSWQDSTSMPTALHCNITKHRSSHHRLQCPCGHPGKHHHVKLCIRTATGGIINSTREIPLAQIQLVCMHLQQYRLESTLCIHQKILCAP